jgi:hypothetical protein
MPAVLERSVRVSTLDRSLAVPDAFAGAGLAFALVYLVVVLLHTFMFVRGDVGLGGARASAHRAVQPRRRRAPARRRALGGDVQWVSSWDAAS